MLSVLRALAILLIAIPGFIFQTLVILASIGYVVAARDLAGTLGLIIWMTCICGSLFAVLFYARPSSFFVNISAIIINAVSNLLVFGFLVPWENGAIPQIIYWVVILMLTLPEPRMHKKDNVEGDRLTPQEEP